MKIRILSTLVLIVSVISSNFTFGDSAALKLSAKAPAESIVSFASSGRDKLSDDFEATLINDVLTDPQINAFANQIREIVINKLNIKGNGLEKVKEFCEMVDSYGLSANARVEGVLFNEVQRFDNGSWICDGCIYTISEGGKARGENIGKLLGEISDTYAEYLEMNTSSYNSDTFGKVMQYNFNIPNLGPLNNFFFTISVAQKDGYCLSILSYKDYAERFLGQLADSMETPSEVTKAFEGIELKGDDIIISYNLPEYFNAIGGLIPHKDQMGPMLDMFDNIGLTNIGTLYYRFGFDNKQIVLDVIGTQHGQFIGMMNEINPENLRAIPSDAAFMMSANYNLKPIIDMYSNMISGMAGPQVIDEINAKIDEAEAQTGINIRDGFLKNITGESVCGFSCNPYTGLMGSVYTEMAYFNDTQAYITATQQLVDFIKPMAGDSIQLNFNANEVDGMTVYTLTIPQAMAFGVQPTFIAIDDNRLIFSTAQAQAIEAAKRVINKTDAGSILENAKFKAVTKDAPKELYGLHFTDSESFLKAVNITANTYYPLLSMAASSKDIVLPPTLPQIANKFDNLPASVSWSTVLSEERVHNHVQSDALGYTALVGGYITTVMSISGMQAMDIANGGQQCMKDMKSMAFALHEYYEDNDNAFPNELSELAEYMECGVPRCNGKSYSYRGSDLTLKNDSHMIMAYCLEHVRTQGAYILYLDGSCEQICWDGFVSKVKEDIQKRKDAGLELKGVDDLILVDPDSGEVSVDKDKVSAKCGAIF